MSHCIKIGSNEKASWILTNAKCSIPASWDLKYFKTHLKAINEHKNLKCIYPKWSNSSKVCKGFFFIDVGKPFICRKLNSLSLFWSPILYSLEHLRCSRFPFMIIHLSKFHLSKEITNKNKISIAANFVYQDSQPTGSSKVSSYCYDHSCDFKGENPRG